MWTRFYCKQVRALSAGISHLFIQYYWYLYIVGQNGQVEKTTVMDDVNNDHIWYHPHLKKRFFLRKLQKQYGHVKWVNN